MTWLEKMDAVLLCLYKLSGDNPRFTDVEKWINENYPNQVDKGEIQDITLYFYNEKLMYLEYGGDRTHKYYEHQDSRYLINCKGKLFWENVGGFKQQKLNDTTERNRVQKIQSDQLLLSRRVAALTAWIAGGTIIAAVYYLLEVYDTNQNIAYYLLGIITVSLLITVWQVWLRKDKQQSQDI